jgi:hypothetical protein
VSNQPIAGLLLIGYCLLLALCGRVASFGAGGTALPSFVFSGAGGLFAGTLRLFVVSEPPPEGVCTSGFSSSVLEAFVAGWPPLLQARVREKIESKASVRRVFFMCD